MAMAAAIGGGEESSRCVCASGDSKLIVIAGLDPAIHDGRRFNMDRRVKPGGDQQSDRLLSFFFQSEQVVQK